MSSFLSAAETNARQVKTLDVIFKNMGEESTWATELALEGHSLFISGQKYNFEP